MFSEIHFFGTCGTSKYSFNSTAQHKVSLNTLFNFISSNAYFILLFSSIIYKHLRKVTIYFQFFHIIRNIRESKDSSSNMGTRYSEIFPSPVI